MFPIFSQNDPRWSGDQLGSCPDTVGQSGCIVACHAMFGASHHLEVTPGELNGVYTQRNLYVGGCLTPDADLAQVFPELVLVEERDFEGPADLSTLSAGALEFVYVGLAKSGVAPATHFVAIAMNDGPDPMIADPWDGTLKRLAGSYGDPATVIVKRVLYRYQPPTPPAPPAPELPNVGPDLDQIISRLQAVRRQLPA